MTKDIFTDIVVCGAGPSGFAAAVSAAQLGLKVMLIERYGFLGGAATACLVNPFMVSKLDGEHLVKGIFEEVIGKLKEKNAAVDGELFGQPHISFDPEILKFILLEMAEEAGIKMMFHSFVSGAVMKENEIKGVITGGKSSDIKIFSKITIDATGDGDIAGFSGALYGEGRETDGLVQPMTLMFKVAGIDVTKMPSRDEINKIYAEEKKEFNIRSPRENLLWFETTKDGELHFNSTRVVKVSGTSVFDLTKAEIEARKQVESIFEFLKNRITGFENSYVSQVASQIGVRESRRIIGDYVLNEEDIIAGTKFDDPIAKGNYPIDIHSPSGGGTRFTKLGPAVYYEIPYRCLIPKKIDNLIVTGRAISTTHEALSSIRIMPTCFALGQAAGAAAAIAIKKNIKPRAVDYQDLRKILNEQNAGMR